MSRQTRITLPLSRTPSVKSSDAVKAQLNKKRQYQKVWYDKTSKPLRPLLEGQLVWMQTQRGHDRLATVKRICKEPRSYIVESGGHDYRRNRRHLLPVLETSPPPAHHVDNGDQAAVTPLTVSCHRMGLLHLRSESETSSAIARWCKGRCHLSSSMPEIYTSHERDAYASPDASTCNKHCKAYGLFFLVFYGLLQWLSTGLLFSY